MKSIQNIVHDVIGAGADAEIIFDRLTEEGYSLMHPNHMQEQEGWNDGYAAGYEEGINDANPTLPRLVLSTEKRVAIDTLLDWADLITTGSLDVESRESLKDILREAAFELRFYRSLDGKS